jgi:hypothetical protein
MILALVVAAHAADDCSFTESDYYQLRQQLQTLHKTAGRSIGVSPATPACQEALQVVLRNGPFLGVHEVQTPNDDPCVALLEPGEGGDGWQLAMNGRCEVESRGPANLLSVGAWLPYGVSGRYNRDMGGGLSLLADFGWAPPRLWSDPFDFSTYGNDNPRSASMRFLLGIDMTDRGLRGTYFGVRGGVETANPIHEIVPTYGAVSFVGGRKWISDGLALQAGGGMLCEIPMGHGPLPSLLTPVVELRAGIAP